MVTIGPGVTVGLLLLSGSRLGRAASTRLGRVR